MRARTKHAFVTASAYSLGLGVLAFFSYFKTGAVRNSDPWGLVYVPAITVIAAFVVILPLIYFFPPKSGDGLANNRARWFVWGFVGVAALAVAASYILR